MLPASITTIRSASRHGLRDVVRDQDRGQPLREDHLLNQTLHIDARQRVERAKRLVEREQAGRAYECARKGDPLPLAAGQN